MPLQIEIRDHPKLDACEVYTGKLRLVGSGDVANLRDELVVRLREHVVEDGKPYVLINAEDLWVSPLVGQQLTEVMQELIRGYAKAVIFYGIGHDVVTYSNIRMQALFHNLSVYVCPSRDEAFAVLQAHS